MTEYEWLLQLAHERGFAVVERFDFKNSNIKGLATKDGIVLSSDLKNDRERKCVLAEEIAHIQINTGNITDLSNLSNKKQEIRAHKLAVKKLVPFSRLIDAIIELREETSIYALAHKLDVTEDFLLEAIEIYGYEYGPRTDYGAYIVFFSPFHIEEKQKA